MIVTLQEDMIIWHFANDTSLMNTFFTGCYSFEDKIAILLLNGVYDSVYSLISHLSN